MTDNIIQFPSKYEDMFWQNASFECVNDYDKNKNQIFDRIYEGLGHNFPDPENIQLYEILGAFHDEVRIHPKYNRHNTKNIVEAINEVHQKYFPKEASTKLLLFHRTGADEYFDNGYEPYNLIFTNNFTIESYSKKAPILLSILATWHTYPNSADGESELLSIPNVYKKYKDNKVYWFMSVVEDYEHY